ncbi:MAG: hypothetical protein WD025_08965 [Bacteriovoracaceae bacterium]
MNHKLSLLIPLIAASCALFVNRFDQNRLTQDISSYKASGKKLYCEESSFELVNSSKAIQDAFQKFLIQAGSRTPLSHVDKSVLWSLVQMNLRPDQASPTSKLQIFLKNGQETEYYHFYSKQKGAWPYLRGLETLLRDYKSKNTLLKLARHVDNLFPSQFFVVKNFEAFLEDNKEKIDANSALKRYYMRADETLKENEKIGKLKLAPLVSHYLRKKKHLNYEHGKTLFSYKGSRGLTARCNYDMRLYSNSIYLIHKDFIKSHLFGMSSKDGSFLASAAQNLEKFEPVDNSLFFKGDSQTRSAAFCSFDYSKEELKSLWLVSSESRDPGQHIYHLMEYGLQSANSATDISDLIGFSRHLFLEDPTRLVFESNRSSKEQLERLLKLNIPVYNARQLGNIWAMFENKNTKGFVIDERTDGAVSCSKR